LRKLRADKQLLACFEGHNDEFPAHFASAARSRASHRTARYFSYFDQFLLFRNIPRNPLRGSCTSSERCIYITLCNSLSNGSIVHGALSDGVCRT
jgi:hypothetical protein